MRAHRWLLLAPIAAATAAGAQPPAAFLDATAQRGLNAQHHAAHPIPGMFAGDQTGFGVGAAASDYDRDGDHDLYVVDTWGYPNRLFRNDGGILRDVTAGSGAGDLGYGHMALFVDLDNDGYDDLFVLNDTDGTNVYPYSQLYRNRGDGTFENVSNGSGVEPVSLTIGGATAGDYDKDGDLDLYVTSWFDRLFYLYRNEGGFRFTDVTDEAGLRVPATYVFHWAPLFVDMDNDGWQDLFCAVDYYPDYLFLNNRDGTFTWHNENPYPYHAGNDMGVAPADFDADGDIDLYTTNITGQFPTEPPSCCNWLYVNDGHGKLVNEAAIRGVQDTRFGWGTWFFDADLDGSLDLLAVNGWEQEVWWTPADFFVNDGAGYFTERSAECGIDHVGNSRGLTPFDVDTDGDTDFAIFDVLSPATLYENVTPRGNRHFLSVRLEGRDSNRNGVGARVYVTTGERTQMQEIVAGGSFYAGPPIEASFGLGEASVVDELRVVWPTGREQTLLSVAADRFLVLVEPSADDGATGAPAVATGTRLAVSPNPAAGPVTIRYRAAAADGGRIAIFDAAGRSVRAFPVREGERALVWDGADDRGAPVPPGVYFVRLEAGAVRETRKIVRLDR